MSPKSSTSTMPQLVLVTGANGYIGSSLVKSLLEQGYRVRGTLRKADLANETETSVLMNMTNASTNLKLVPLELAGPPQTFDEVAQEVEWIFHVASPVGLAKVKDEQNFIGPAVNGTLNMLRAANATSTVRKFILTSSIAAVVSGAKECYNEDDWANAEGSESIAYFKSKELSEKAAWKFMEENNPTFTLSCINPGIVLGPVQSGNVTSTPRILVSPLQGGGIFNMFCNLVDIRDVVKAHIQAAKIPEAAGKRFIIVQSDGGELFMPEMCAILKKEFGPMGYEISTSPAPKWVIWLLSWVNAEIAGMYAMIDSSIHIDNSRSREILELEYIQVEQTLVDGGYSLIEHGVVEKKPGYRRRNT